MGMKTFKQSALVEGTFFKVNYYAFTPHSLYIKRIDNKGPALEVHRPYYLNRNAKAKLIDTQGKFIEQLDPFNPLMMAEFQNCVNFAVKALEDME